MIDICRTPDDITIICDEETVDSTVRFISKGRQLDVFLTAKSDRPRFVILRWHYRTNESVKVLGDKWERAYADLSWSSINPNQFMPWYFLVQGAPKQFCLV